MPAIKDNIGQELLSEQLRMEKVRVINLIAFICFVSALAIIAFFIAANTAIVEEVIDNRSTVIYGLGALGLFVLFELYTLRKVKNHQKRYAKVHFVYGVISTLIEVSVPTIIIFIYVLSDHRILVLDLSIINLYYAFIILSSLRLDYRLCILGGVLSAIEYVLASYWAMDYLELHQPMTLYIGRGMFIALSGGLAGFIAFQMRKSILQALINLQERRSVEMLFGQHVSPEIAQELLKENGIFHKTEVQASIMFFDLRNFTPLAESKSPDEIIELQNKIFNPLIDIVTEHHGVINQILGDGFMATFGAPIVNENNPEQALLAGYKICQKMDELVANRKIPYINFGIGLHYGPVVVGNIGNEVRKQFSVTGKTVIISARLEQLNKELGTRFLVSENIFGATNQTKFPMVPAGTFHLKGIGEDMLVYEVQALVSKPHH